MEKYKNIHITINEVTKEYKKNQGIKSVTTKFDSGVLNLVTGENGSGKSTLFKCIMGLVNYSGNIDKKKIKIGYAPEEYLMPLRMTVMDFLYSIGRVKGLDDDETNENIKFYLEYFDLLKYKKKPISELSNGMKQKLNLLQAFVHNPKIIILDEPLASLDKIMIPKVISLVKEKAAKKLVVISTHQPHKFNTKKKRIYHFEKGRLIDD